MTQPIKTLSPDQKDTPFKALRHWPEGCHVFDPASITAVNAAICAGRPLLLRGEPGSGKSQLARAVASALKRPFLYRIVNGRTEPEDLLHKFDAISRLATAQLGQKDAKLDPDLYLMPDILWWALNPVSAKARYGKAKPHCGSAAVDYSECRETGYPLDGSAGAVVLIDEIDKADAELPNSLLEVLSLGGFQVPYDGSYVCATDPAPLIIITTNEDRELPPAFVRRCLVHQMDLPDSAEELEKLLLPRVKAKLEAAMDDSIIQQAIAMLATHREDMNKRGLPKPGQAELIDLLRAVDEYVSEHDGTTHQTFVDRMAPYFFQKYPK